jgi:hypothetical protein
VGREKAELNKKNFERRKTVGGLVVEYVVEGF